MREFHFIFSLIKYNFTLTANIMWIQWKPWGPAQIKRELKKKRRGKNGEKSWKMKEKGKRKQELVVCWYLLTGGRADGSRYSSSSFLCVVAASFKRDSRLLIIFHHASQVFRVSLWAYVCVCVCVVNLLNKSKKRGDAVESALRRPSNTCCPVRSLQFTTENLYINMWMKKKERI